MESINCWLYLVITFEWNQQTNKNDITASCNLSILLIKFTKTQLPLAFYLSCILYKIFFWRLSLRTKHFVLHEKCEKGTKKAIFPEIKFYRAICRRGVARRGCDNTQDRESQTAANPAPHCHIVPHYECLFRTISKSISNIDTTNFNTENILSVGEKQINRFWIIQHVWTLNICFILFFKCQGLCTLL